MVYPSLATLGVVGVALGSIALASQQPTSKPPNVLFLFTDDQDLLLGSLKYVDAITNRVQSHGFTFDNHHATVSLCCPSRVALLRGQHAHNTNITYVSAPGGGYEKWVASGQDQDYLPHWIKRAGYRAEHIGKLMNGYGTNNWANSPKGWDHFDGLLDPYTYIYNSPVFSTNGETPVYYTEQHQTDVIHAKAVTRLKALLAGDQPWFLTVAPVAPHQQFNSTGKWPPVPLARHANLYPGLKAPRTPNFNPKHHHKPSWVGELPYMDSASIAFSDETYRRRAQALAGVNEIFHDLLDILEQSGELDNTYVIFSADHGYHVGQHRIPAGKTLPYREDTQVPFIIRGPGVPHGHSRLPSHHVDLAPTLLKLIGLPQGQWPTFLDGRDLSAYWSGDEHHVRAKLQPAPETIQIEYWGNSIIETAGLNLTTYDSRNTYKTVRIVGDNYGYLYSHWCTNETEAYDTVADPYELTPLDLSSKKHIALSTRLNGLLLASKSCEQNSCRSPWSILHPDGSVSNLRDALKSKHDAFYASLPRVAFKECLDYQLRSNEEPFYPPFTDGVGPTLGELFRKQTDAFGLAARAKSESTGANANAVLIPEAGRFGETYAGPEAIVASARELTDEELGLRTMQVRDFYGEL
ncbi:alkaline-phosphatase-like protein [Fomes fomentarius]|nr:alkaline-phosphatase-like protein [Fomes fomentarius]